MIEVTPKAVEKILEIMKNQFPPAEMAKRLLRISVIGGGCSGFQYSMAFEEKQGPLDKVYEFAGSSDIPGSNKIRVVVDQASLLYLDGTTINYLETLEGSGFKFTNPNTKSTCGCGSSFQV